MSFITNLLTLINWNVRRRTHSYGGNGSASTETNWGSILDEIDAEIENEIDADKQDNDHPEFGLEFIADREGQHEYPDSDIGFIDQLEPAKPRLKAKDVPFASAVRFCDDEPGGWIITDETIVIDWEDL